MKKVHVYYTCHCDREDSFPQPLFAPSILKDTRRDEADFSFDAEDAVADELLDELGGFVPEIVVADI